MISSQHCRIEKHHIPGAWFCAHCSHVWPTKIELRIEPDSNLKSRLRVWQSCSHYMHDCTDTSRAKQTTVWRKTQRQNRCCLNSTALYQVCALINTSKPHIWTKESHNVILRLWLWITWTLLCSKVRIIFLKKSRFVWLHKSKYGLSDTCDSPIFDWAKKKDLVKNSTLQNWLHGLWGK